MKTKAESQKLIDSIREEIIVNAGNAKHLELLYQKDKSSFKLAFDQLESSLKGQTLLQAWNERLKFQRELIVWGSKMDWMVVLTLCLLAGLVAKIPDFTGMDEEFFYPRNLSFIVFPYLTAFFAWKQNLAIQKVLIILGVYLLAIVYINLLPNNIFSDTLALACIHLPFILWAIASYTFGSGKLNDLPKRLEFLRFNGDFAVMTTILLIAGAILSGITLGLFHFINFDIEEFYFQYVAIWGLAAIPVMSTFLVRTNPQLVSKVSPIIARIFTPLVLVMLVIYLFAIVGSGKNPFTDRDFLIIFNVLLIGVMAIILFSISENVKNTSNKLGNYLLLSLSIVTIIVNCIALSAILYRMSEWGLTPNRLAVLGGNILILINLVMVTYKLFISVKSKAEMESVGLTISRYLPVYVIWAVVVTFLFPVLFAFA